MEIKEAERVVIAKPVASKPTCTTFRSFSELLAGAIDASPPIACSKAAVPAIRPKTVRFKSMGNRSSCEGVSSQGEPSRSAASNLPEDVLKSDCKPTVVYKPTAKLVSKSTVSLLANMGNAGHQQALHSNFTGHQQALQSNFTSHQQALQAVEARARPLNNQYKYNFSSQNSLNLHQTSTVQTKESSKTASQNLEEDPKSLPSSVSGDRPSYDGYNWRKYGQKQVKGSEYPRSYYKCTHPNCPVKKKVERSLDGQIAEIVYKGEHNHPKPQPPKRNSSSMQGQGIASNEAAQDTNFLLRANQVNERNEGSESRVENQNEVVISTPLSFHGRAPMSYDPPAIGTACTGAGTRDNSCALSGECDDGSKGLEEDEPRSKRRRGENQSSEAGTSADGIQEPRIVVQNSTDNEIIGDGFRWRKYGQKVVKGNPFPRSYYRCTNLKCNVRKHVERTSNEPGAFITTYEGKHNHDMPIKHTNSGASEPNSSKDKQ